MRIESKSDYKMYLSADLDALNIKPTLKNKLTHDIWSFQKSLRKLEYYLNCKHGLLSRVYTVLLRLRVRKKGRKLEWLKALPRLRRRFPSTGVY